MKIDSRLLPRIGSLAVSVLLAEPLIASSYRPFEPMRELRGITAVRIEVDGMPNPLQGTDVSEVTLAAAVKAELGRFNVPIADKTDLSTLEVPTLHITVLASLVNGAYYYVIQLSLIERCSVPRGPELRIPWCATWYIPVRFGFLNVDAAGTLQDKVLLAVSEFGKRYARDNE